MPPAQRFFTPGDALDRAYCNVRDLPECESGREFVESLWQEYWSLADRHFLSDARSHFLQRFWEMYLAVALKQRGLRPTKVSDEGPEFHFGLGGERVWVEAVAPQAGTGPDAVPDPPLGRAYRPPQERILLRFTSCLAEKRAKYNQAITKRIVQSRDHYVVAVNCRGIPHAPHGTYIPYAVMAWLPIGYLKVAINRSTLEVVDTYCERRDHVLKLSGSRVATDSLLNPDYSGISGVLHSAADPMNRPPEMGGDFWFLHNPLAARPLGLAVFSWCRQYVLDGETLRTIQPSQRG